MFILFVVVSFAILFLLMSECCLTFFTTFLCCISFVFWLFEASEYDKHSVSSVLIRKINVQVIFSHICKKIVYLHFPSFSVFCVLLKHIKKFHKIWSEIKFSFGDLSNSAREQINKRSAAMLAVKKIAIVGIFLLSVEEKNFTFYLILFPSKRATTFQKKKLHFFVVFCLLSDI